MAESRPTGGAAARRGVGRTTKGENHAKTRNGYKYIYVVYMHLFIHRLIP